MNSVPRKHQSSHILVNSLAVSARKDVDAVSAQENCLTTPVSRHTTGALNVFNYNEQELKNLENFGLALDLGVRRELLDCDSSQEGASGNYEQKQ